MDAPTTLAIALQRAAFGLFSLTVLLSVAAVKLAAGPVPVRTVTLLACGACLIVADGRQFGEAIAKARWLLGVIAGVAALGLVVSVLAQAPIAGVVQQLIEIHLQAAVGAIITWALVLRFGIVPVLGCFLAVYALNAVVAIGQALHVDAAWGIRAFIGRLMHDSPLTQITYVTRYRALGLSFSPVHFGTQTCLAFAATLYLRMAGKDASATRLDWWIVGVSIVLVLLCAVTGNRSPVLGLLAFLAIYVTITAPRLTLALLPLVLIAAFAAIPLLGMLSESGLRVANTDDGSALGRATLRAYGWFLIEQRPIGYGLTFDSIAYWPTFQHQASYMENSMAIRRWPIHNYYLNMLAKYGVLVLGFIPFVLPRNRDQAFLWLAFIPYAVHIYYHNDGPFQADFLIFYILPAATLLASKWQATAQADRSAKRRRLWRRAFASPATPA